MSLQSNSFTGGNPDWNAGLRGFVITLNLTENSVSEANNTSNISYELILSNPGHHYDFWYPFTEYVELILGDVDLSQNITGFHIGRDLNGNKSNDWSQTILKGTTNVYHEEDGTLDMLVAVTFPNIAAKAAGPYGMEIWDKWTLTPITLPRNHNIDFNGNVVDNFIFNGQPVNHLIYNGLMLF